MLLIIQYYQKKTTVNFMGAFTMMITMITPIIYLWFPAASHVVLRLVACNIA